MQAERSERGSKPSSRGDQTRAAVLSKAAEIASREGLEALTIGRLARQLRMSKSGLFAHFGSKQRLQLATIERAKENVSDEVFIPAETVPTGLARLWSLCDLWMKGIEREKHSPVHFFTAAIFAYGFRAGPIARASMAVTREWLSALKRASQEARELEEIRPEADIKDTPRQLMSIVTGGYGISLLGEPDAFTQARAAIVVRLHDLATDKIPPEAMESVKAWRKYLEK